MNKAWQGAIAIGVCMLVSLPLALVATFLAMPIWSFAESRFQVESVGHSGPATWCYVAVYITTVATLTAAVLVARRRNR